MKKVILHAFTILVISFTACDYFDDGYDHYKSADYESSIIDNDILYGKWGALQDIDSVVLIFNSLSFKEYIFQAGTNNILDRKNYEHYYLTERRYNDGKISYYINYNKDTIYETKYFKILDGFRLIVSGYEKDFFRLED